MGNGASAPRPSQGAPGWAETLQRVQPSPPRGVRLTRQRLLHTIRTLAEQLQQTSLLLENAVRERPPTAIPGTECVICMEAQVSVALVPCGHLVLCGPCASRLWSGATTSMKCPMCRTEVRERLLTYLPDQLPAGPLADGPADDAPHDVSDATPYPSCATQTSPPRRPRHAKMPCDLAATWG